MEVKAREEAFLDRLRVLKHFPPNTVEKPSNVSEDEAVLFLFKIDSTTYTGRPGTSSEAVVRRQSYQACKAVRGLAEVQVKNSLTWSLPLEEESSKAVSKEISEFIKSCFRFDDGGLTRRDHSLVFFATVCKVVSSEEYFNGRKKQVGTDYDEDSDDVEEEDDEDDDDVMLGVADDGGDEEEVAVVDEVEGVVGEVLGEGRLEVVKAGLETRKLELMERGEGVRETDCECSICLRPLVWKVRSKSKSKVLSWVPEAHSWDVVRLSCGHVFHYACIFNWLPKNQSCPYCRSTSLTYL